MTDDDVAANIGPGLEDLISRRCGNTGETRTAARAAILKVHRQVLEGRLVLAVIDQGVHIGNRDADGYHPNANDPTRRGRS